MNAQLASCLSDIRRMSRLTGDTRSLVRYSVHRVLAMTLGRFPLPVSTSAIHSLHLVSDVSLRYRLNRGDLQSLREVYLDCAYRLPFDGKRATLVDLGANIGLSSLWLAKRYECERVVCVEPSPPNLQLLIENTGRNGVGALVVAGAIAERDGEARFAISPSSNLGRLSDAGIQVKTVSMCTLLRLVEADRRINLLKVDIEGAEASLFGEGDRAWLEAVDEIVIEIHPPQVDRRRIAEILRSAGFAYYPPGSRAFATMDYFRRDTIHTSAE